MGPPICKDIIPTTLDASEIPPEPRSVLLRSGSASRLESRQRLQSWLDDHIKRREAINYDQPSNHSLSSPGVHNLIPGDLNNNDTRDILATTTHDNQSSQGSSLFDSSNDEPQQRITLSALKNNVHSSHSPQSIDGIFSDDQDVLDDLRTNNKNNPAAIATATTAVVPDQDDDADTVQYSPNSTTDTIPYEPYIAQQRGDDASTLPYNPNSPSTQHDGDTSTLPYNPASPSTRNDDEASTYPYNPVSPSIRNDDNDDADTVPYDTIDSPTSNHAQQVPQPTTVLQSTTTSTFSLFDSFDDDDLFDEDDDNANSTNINHQYQDNRIQRTLGSPDSGSLHLSDLEEEQDNLDSSKKKLAQPLLQRFFSVSTNKSSSSSLLSLSSTFIPPLNNHEDEATSSRQKNTEDDIFSSMSSLSTAKSFSTNNSPMTSRQYPSSLAFTPSPFAKRSIDYPTFHTIPTTTTTTNSPFASSSSSSLRPQRIGLSRRSRGQQPTLFDVSKGIEQSTSQSTSTSSVRKRTRFGLRPPPPPPPS
ncbi:hypothetical protein K492DRAFT_207627 [Lichtheimia hyalospora FSU 10163]|nr:hypothetical protein K492DRAFT_207627 [Lichtheimia hyalospora FSU 10163]